MKINPVLLLPFCFTLLAGTACADYALIKYRSGSVQKIRLDESSSRIVSISYQEENPSAAEPLSSGPARAGTDTDCDTAAPGQKGAGSSKSNNKPEVRIEWAQPLE